MSRDLERQSSRSSRPHDFLIKLRGIPFTSTKEDIKRFLSPCRHVAIHLFSNSGSSSGECLVDLQSDADVRDALNKDREFMGKRYIEVFRATEYEYKFFVKHQGMVSWREPVIRIRSLPATCTMANVQDFFQDIEIATNGIYISRDMSDNASGDGFVAFVNMDHAYKAIDLYDRSHMQHSTIQLSPSTYDEAKRIIMNDAFLNGKRFADEEDIAPKKTEERNHLARSRQRSRSQSSNRDRPVRIHRPPTISPRPRSSRPHMKTIDQRARAGNRRQSRSRSPLRRSSVKANRNGEYRMKMRGMPYTIVEKDAIQFFPSSCQPVRIEILLDRRTDRPNGDGYAFFNTLEKANEAMKCHRKYMGKRYVELYLESSPPSSAERRPSRNIESPPRSSRSSKQSPNPVDQRSRSRSESQHE